MGAVVRRIIVLVAVLAALVPQGAKASTQQILGLPWDLGPQGGDRFNHMQRNVASGEMTLVRATPGTPGGALGCDGEAGYTNFSKSFVAGGAVKGVTVFLKEAVVNPYTWISVSLRQGDRYIDSVKVRGPILVPGETAVRLVPDEAVSGPMTLWFGMETAQSCGNFDGGRAIFDGIQVVTA